MFKFCVVMSTVCLLVYFEKTCSERLSKSSLEILLTNGKTVWIPYKNVKNLNEYVKTDREKTLMQMKLRCVRRSLVLPFVFNCRIIRKKQNNISKHTRKKFSTMDRVNDYDGFWLIRKRDKIPFDADIFIAANNLNNLIRYSEIGSSIELRILPLGKTKVPRITKDGIANIFHAKASQSITDKRRMVSSRAIRKQYTLEDAARAEIKRGQLTELNIDLISSKQNDTKFRRIHDAADIADSSSRSSSSNGRDSYKKWLNRNPQNNNDTLSQLKASETEDIDDLRRHNESKTLRKNIRSISNENLNNSLNVNFSLHFSNARNFEDHSIDYKNSTNVTTTDSKTHVNNSNSELNLGEKKTVFNNLTTFTKLRNSNNLIVNAFLSNLTNELKFDFLKVDNKSELTSNHSTSTFVNYSNLTTGSINYQNVRACRSCNSTKDLHVSDSKLPNTKSAVQRHTTLKTNEIKNNKSIHLIKHSRFHNLVEKVESLENKIAELQELVVPREYVVQSGYVKHFTMSNLLEKLMAAKSSLRLLEKRVGKLELLYAHSTDCSRTTDSGVREIYQLGSPVSVYCDKGWTVIQKRFNGSTDFYRTWNDYKNGFGDPAVEYWLGNELLHKMTSLLKYRLRISMTDWKGMEYHAEYSTFHVESEVTGYRLRVAGYSGNIYDSLRRDKMSKFNHNGEPFSTYDRKNNHHVETNCAVRFHGAWWYNNCFAANLNGRYCGGNTTSNECMVWYDVKGKIIMKRVTMAIKV